MQYIDLAGFERFIKGRDLVPEKYRSYYAAWVLRFLKAEFPAEALGGKDRILCFFDQLARDDSVQDWQLKQAEQAVRLYLDVYLPEANGGPDPDRKVPVL